MEIAALQAYKLMNELICQRVEEVEFSFTHVISRDIRTGH